MVGLGLGSVAGLGAARLAASHYSVMTKTFAMFAAAILSILTVVVTLGINMAGGKSRSVQVPDVRGQLTADAVATLQNKGFKTRTQQKPDNTVLPDHVINTEPTATSTIAAGDEVTVNVSTGPEQREVPDVSTLSYADAVKKLTAAGFGKFKQADGPSTPEQKGKTCQGALAFLGGMKVPGEWPARD